MNPPLHIVAVWALVHKWDRYLLVKSPRRGWEFPGGQVEVGEDLLTALAREVREESGIEITHPEIVGIYSNISTNPSRLVIDFRAEYDGGNPQTSNESLEVGWFRREEVMNLVTHPVYRYRLENFWDFSGKVYYMSYQTEPEWRMINNRV